MSESKIISPYFELVEKLGHLMAVGGRLGCSWVSIKNWSTGKANPSAEYRKKIIELCKEYNIEFKFSESTQKENTEMLEDIIVRLSKLEENSITIKETESIDDDTLNNIVTRVSKLEQDIILLQKRLKSLDKSMGDMYDIVEILKKKAEV